MSTAQRGRNVPRNSGASGIQTNTQQSKQNARTLTGTKAVPVANGIRIVTERFALIAGDLLIGF
jgi:hypothetical protein